MGDKKNKKSIEIEEAKQTIDSDVTLNDVVEESADTTNVEEVDELEALRTALQQKEEELEKVNKEYLFLMAEFDNFKKRMMRERAELMRNAAEQVLKGLLPILDDFERGLTAIKDTSDADAVKEGMQLIYKKFVKYLELNGVKEIPTNEQPFDVDYHEAIAMVPVGDESLKGKVIDTVLKGYILNDKVIRHAKVVVGQ